MPPASTRPRIAPIQRLGSAPPSAIEGIDWVTPIDPSRWFLCETLTPLYYTRVYGQLSLEHRRRYNQLTGMFTNELIAFLEREFLDAVLNAVRSGPPGRDEGAALHEAVSEFRIEEQRHQLLWRRLNRLSDPERYGQTDRVFLRVPAALVALARLAARHPGAMPVVFWIQLIQEERSVEISRRCARMPADRIEPRYAAMYRAHLRDEIRHVRIDCHLIEQFYAKRSAAVRWTTAVLLHRLLAAAFLAPGRSTSQVIAALTKEHPELRMLLPLFRRELRSVSLNPDYQRMMYSRETTPIAFELFDRFPEFSRMQTVLRAYKSECERRK